MSEQLKSTLPKNTESGVLGGIGIGAMWVWNTFHTYEDCTPLKDVCEIFYTKWYLDDPLISASIILVVTFITGPFVRWVQALGEKKDQKNSELLTELKKFNEARKAGLE